MTSYARIAVNVPSLAGVFVESENGGRQRSMMAFDYDIPPELEGRLDPGHLVVVPLAGRTVQGVVLELPGVPAVSQTKSIVQLCDPEPVLTASQLALAKWMAGRTLAPLGAIIGLFLPPGLAQQADVLYAIRATDEQQRDQAATSTVGSRLLAILQDRSALRGRQIDRLLPRVEWRRTAQALVRRGILDATPVLPPAGVRPTYVRTVQLAKAPAEAKSETHRLGSTEATRERRRQALEYLLRHPEPVNVSWVYAETGCNLADLHALADLDLVLLREQELWRDPLARSAADAAGRTAVWPAPPIVLTAEQESAWEIIQAALDQPEAEGRRVPILLQGVTGSGKTELYIRAALEVVRRGRGVILLVPEIALTPQTVQRFMVHFPGQVGLVHSKLSDGERYDTWRRARAGTLKVVIGPRSALFSPLPSVGLVVVDECHDGSYHQADPPFYDAVAAAQAYASVSGATCIMGSATPSIVQRHDSDVGGSIRIELTQRVSAGADAPQSQVLALPQVHVVDMREELKAGNRSSLSRRLKNELAQVLSAGEQAILFLNRRGTAAHVFCRNCGHVARCPRCDTPLTYHTGGIDRLLCHRCAYERGVPRKCPECGSPDIRAYGLGTEKVETEIRIAFPRARTLRWDWETTRRKESHELILHHFASGHADVLIGTQMLAKGLDLPNVTLVGIVMADVGLFLPDPFAAERVFQLLTQVAGRAGRSERGGRVILQTFAPEHYAIKAASRHDVNGFHEYEVSQRRRLGFPPFTRLLRLEYRHHDAVRAEEAARGMAASLQRRFSQTGHAQTAIIGPAPCFFAKLDGRYRWQIILRGSDPGVFLEGQRLADWRIEADPVTLL